MNTPTATMVTASTAGGPVNISSIIVSAAPGHLPQVHEQLSALAGVEVHLVSEDGRMVVTIEAESDGKTVDCFELIRQMPGVLSASMVYHQFEPEPDEEA